ncbi:MAG: lamin tail domain-containing protein [Alphaproteobacteria bacterium]|nr:lamin tail domain-containing protein [Alphaproteobacteria bacterium]
MARSLSVASLLLAPLLLAGCPSKDAGDDDDDGGRSDTDGGGWDLGTDTGLTDGGTDAGTDTDGTDTDGTDTDGSDTDGTDTDGTDTDGTDTTDVDADTDTTDVDTDTDTDGTTDADTDADTDTDGGTEDPTIADIQTGVYGPGEIVTVSGVAANNANGLGFWLLDEDGGRYNGIFVYTAAIGTLSSVARGDALTVTGEVYEYSSVVDSSATELIPASSSAVVETGRGTIPAPTVLGTASFSSASTMEPYEGTLVTIEDVTVTDPAVAFGEIEYDGVARTDDMLYGAPTVSEGDTYTSITGLLHYTYGSWKLEVRDASDFEGYTAGALCSVALCADELTAGDLVIAEVMYNPAAGDDSDNEWIEVYNAAGATVDLKGLTIGDSGTYTSTISTSVVVPAGGRAVLANGDGSGWAYGFTADAYYGSSPALSNTGDKVSLSYGSTLIDETATWASGETGAGVSWQLNRTSHTAVANDSSANWCASTATIGSTSDAGTPGAVNAGC